MLPTVPDLDALATCAANYKDATAKCHRYSPDGECVIGYPCLGPPPPNQPNVCRFTGPDGSVCGVGGHSSRTHTKPVSLSTRALTQAVWLLENMEFLKPEQAVKQIMAMFHVMCALEERRQERLAQGLLATTTAEIKSILIMYQAVTGWFTKYTPSSSSVSTRPKFRSTTNILSELLSTLIQRPSSTGGNAILEDIEAGEQTCFVVFLFPLDHTRHLPRNDDAKTLRQLCATAFAQQDTSLIVRMAQGHRPNCQDPATCECNDTGDVFIKGDKIERSMVSCRQCGLIGHNQGSCRSRTTATHVAMALATLIDPQKSLKITPKVAHMSLYNCYQTIVALLYQWCNSTLTTTHQWRIEGVTRLRTVDCNHPELLLRLFNHTVATLKTQPKFGKNMLVIARPRELMLEAAYAYEKTARGLRPESVNLKQRAIEATEAFQDEDLALPRPLLMTPAKRRTVCAMVQSSARADPRVAAELREHQDDIGLRFAFDDLVFQ